MSKIAVVTDTNSGITREEAKKLGVYLLPMPILIDGNAYYEHQSITPKEFYEKMRAKADISTTQPSPADLMDLWEEILKTPPYSSMKLQQRCSITRRF